MSDRKAPSDSGWVNAVIELRVPMDTVTPGASAEAKLAEAEVVYGDLIADLPEVWHEHVLTTSWEDADDE